MVVITHHVSLFFIAVLNEQMKEAEGSPAEYEKEIEELKELLPEIREKIEDAKESQRSGNVAELALKAALVSSDLRRVPSFTLLFERENNR